MSSLPLWGNAVVFVAASVAIWWAGTLVETYTDRISRRTGMGQAFSGMLLLAGATSLPELATTVTAVAFLGNPTLAVHNLLGGVALQTGLLVVADAVKRKRGALTFFSPSFALLMQGVGLLLLLQIAIAGIAARGAPAPFSTSAWLVLLVAGYLATMYLVYRHRSSQRWKPSNVDQAANGSEGAPDPDAGRDSERRPEPSLRRLWLTFSVASAVVLAGGWFAAQSADLLAEQTGLGSAFLGATLLAAATSLPELSTTIAASRNERYTAAVSNIFGSNALDVSLLFVAELFYRGSSVLANVESTVVFVAALGASMTALYLWGLLERENRSVFGIGWDSAAALFMYVGGMVLLYSLS